MSSRTAPFVSVLFATLLAGASFVTASHGAPAEAEAEKCLSGPQGAAPAGGHWYYRVDRATKRACWYIGDAKGKVSGKIARATPETSPPVDDSASPPNSTGTSTPSAIANARAEWPSPSSRGGPDASVYTAPRPLATVGGAIRPGSDQRPNADDAGAQGPVATSRWGELAGSSTQASPGPAMNESAPANSGAASTLSGAASPASTLAPPAAVSALPPAAADAPSTEKPVGSVQMLLIAILGALALAGLLASAIFRLSGRRQNNHRVDRRVNWDSVRTDRASLSDETRSDRSIRELGLLPQGSLPRELRAADDADKRIARLLSRPRRAAS